MIFSRQTYWLTLLILYLRGHAAHNRRKKLSKLDISDNKNDKTITNFDETGRLLQVEYARRASERGGSVVCASLDFTCLDFFKKNWKYDISFDGSSTQVHDGRERGHVVIMAVEHKDSLNMLPVNSSDNCELEKRFTYSIPSITDKVHRIDTHVVLVTTGLAGDGHIIANELRRIALIKRLNNGISLSNKRYENEPAGESIGIKVLARECASLQQQLTWTVGARPLGISSTIVGVEPYRFSMYSSLDKRSVKLYGCDPGGGAEEYEFLATGTQSQIIQKQLLSLINNLKKDMQHSTSQMTILSRDRPIISIDTSKHLQETLLKQLIYGTASITFDNGVISHSRSSNKMVDIYVIERNVLCRGGVHIRSAGLVEKSKLMKACSLLSYR